MDDSVAHNPALRTVLETARAWGVSPSRFSGAEQSIRLVYGQNQFNESVVVAQVIEPEWTAEDRELAIELTAYEASLCPGCHHPMTETTDPANEHQYVAQLPVRCHRCTVSSKAMEKYEESDVPGALYMPVVLRGTE
jgi:hypothetical protein